MSDFCEMAFDHEPNEICESCNLKVDGYGNTEEDFINCCFPDCGCNGHRLCMAESGPSEAALGGNVEDMYQRNDLEAIKAVFALVARCGGRK